MTMKSSLLKIVVDFVLELQNTIIRQLRTTVDIRMNGYVYTKLHTCSSVDSLEK